MPLPAPPAFSPAEIRTIVVGLMLALFLSSLDQTIVATALPAIAGDLGGWEMIAWVVSAYLIASTVTAPIYGRLSDLFGRRPVLLVSITLFVAGAVLCALAGTMAQLIAARVVQGLGGGGLRSVALAVVGDILPPRERGRYQGYLSTAFGTANVIGPVLGGLFAEYLSWHWIFWVDVPLGAAAFAMTYHQLRRLGRPGKRPVIDWLGAALILASATPLLLGISAVQRSGRWDSPDALASFGIGLAALVALMAWERRAPEPMLPLRLFAVREFTLAILTTFCSSMVSVGLVVLIPLNYQLLVGLSANESGMRLIAMTLGTVTGSFLAGQMVTRFGRYRAFPLFGSSVAAVVCVALAVVGLGRSPVFDWVATMMLGLAIGGQMSPTTVAIQNALEPRDGGIGVACMMFFRLLGGAFGVAALSALLIGQLAGGLPAEAAVLGADPGLALFRPDRRAALPPAVLEALTGPLADAFTMVFVACAAILVCGALAAFSLKDLPLRER
ncbi:MAG: MFS transporter [Acetobacteraceae bacterium]|nr:MFS transporter [Acetobacteraceae bacterium]